MQHIDIAIFRLINSRLSAPWLDQIMLAITTYGSGAGQTALSLLFVSIGWLQDKVAVRRVGYAGVIANLLSMIAIALAKSVWRRPRPLLVLFDVHVVGQPLFTRSFPSGHTLTSFAVATACSALEPRLGYVLFPLAVLVAWSRVYVGAHFPFDTVGGALLGVLVGMWSKWLLQRLVQTEAEGKGDA